MSAAPRRRAGRDVASTAQEQVGQVAHEARRQAKDLLGEARQQAQEQARAGQEKAYEGLRTLSDELHQMAGGVHDRGPASDLAEQAAGKIGDLAAWLDRHEPGELLEEVRGLARRRPGAFLLGAVAAGVLAGRLTRGVVDAQRNTDTDEAHNGLPSSAAPRPTPRYAPAPSSAADRTSGRHALRISEPAGHPAGGRDAASTGRLPAAGCPR